MNSNGCSNFRWFRTAGRREIIHDVFLCAGYREGVRTRTLLQLTFKQPLTVLPTDRFTLLHWIQLGIVKFPNAKV